MSEKTKVVLRDIALSGGFGRVDIAALHRALQADGVKVSYATVRAWFDGTRACSARMQREVAVLCRASDEDRLRLFQSFADEPRT